MLGQRQVNEMKAGPYVWTTYQDVYDAAIRMDYGFSHQKPWCQSCANAVEFIINHAEVSRAFGQENKILAIISCLPNCSTHLKTIVSFTNVSSTQKKEAEELGVSCFSWEEFFQLRNSDCEVPPKHRTAVAQ